MLTFVEAIISTHIWLLTHPRREKHPNSEPCQGRNDEETMDRLTTQSELWQLGILFSHKK